MGDWGKVCPKEQTFYLKSEMMYSHINIFLHFHLFEVANSAVFCRQQIWSRLPFRSDSCQKNRALQYYRVGVSAWVG